MSIMNRGHTVSDHIVYKMKDTQLEIVDLFKDLGVLFDPTYCLVAISVKRLVRHT